MKNENETARRLQPDCLHSAILHSAFCTSPAPAAWSARTMKRPRSRHACGVGEPFDRAPSTQPSSRRHHAAADGCRDGGSLSMIRCSIRWSTARIAANLDLQAGRRPPMRGAGHARRVRIGRCFPEVDADRQATPGRAGGKRAHRLRPRRHTRPEKHGLRDPTSIRRASMRRGNWICSAEREGTSNRPTPALWPASKTGAMCWSR